MKHQKKSEPVDELIKCSNCQQRIRTSKMFLHEGFCTRNNTYCPKCKNVVLKKDYEKHLSNNCSLSKIQNSETKSNNLVIKIISQDEEEINHQHPITINQINYRSCINMNISPFVKNIAKTQYNEPIIITTDPLNSRELIDKENQKFYSTNSTLLKLLYQAQTDSQPHFAQKIGKIETNNNSRKTSYSFYEDNYFICQKIEQLSTDENIDIDEIDRKIRRINTFNNFHTYNKLTYSSNRNDRKEPIDSKKSNASNKNEENKEINKKYERCEYCNKVTKDLLSHYYRCKERRLFEIERIRSKQDDEMKKRNLQNIDMTYISTFNGFPKSNRPLTTAGFEKKNDLSEFIKKTKHQHKNSFYRLHSTNKIKNIKNISIKKVSKKYPVDRKRKSIL